jgi:hypothetical protein
MLPAVRIEAMEALSRPWINANNSSLMRRRRQLPYTLFNASANATPQTIKVFN